MTRLILVDDHAMFRQSLRKLLEDQNFSIVGEASDGREAVRLARTLDPDIAILDVSMPLLNGIDAAHEIHRLAPRTQVILLTMYREDAYILEALRAGIRGYVLKDQAASDLVAAVGDVMNGSIYLSPGISEAVVKAYKSKSATPEEPLSSRERQVLQLVAEGNTTKQIASILNVSVKTADSHRTRIMKKLDIHETASLVRYAIRLGLIKP